MEIEESTLNLYRAALIALCNDNGGGVVIKTPEMTPPGTIMSRWVDEGVEFKFIADGEAH